jgi:hypothetical protein
LTSDCGGSNGYHNRLWKRNSKSATKTTKGLTVTWVLDTDTYETGKKVLDEVYHKITI